VHLASLGDSALDALELDVVGVVGLDVGGESVQSALDGFLGGRVHHAGLLCCQRPIPNFFPRPCLQPSILSAAPRCSDKQMLNVTHILRRIIGAPSNERNLGPRSLATGQIILDIVDGIATTDSLLAPAVLALGVEQLFAEHVEVGLVGRLLHHDLFPVVADLVDYPFNVFAELELVELADAVRVYGDTGVVVLVWVRGVCEGGVEGRLVGVRVDGRERRGNAGCRLLSSTYPD
jgi:hypothetical protein